MPDADDKTHNVNLDEETHLIIVRKQAEILARDGKTSYSAAVREIVQEWLIYRTREDLARR